MLLLSPRWLQHKGFLSRLDALDRQYADESRNGPLFLEIHYRGGRPLVAKIREEILAPIMIEMGLTVVMASTS